MPKPTQAKPVNAIQEELNPNSETFKKKEFQKKSAELAASIAAYEEFLTMFVINKPVPLNKEESRQEKSSSKGNEFVLKIKQTYEELIKTFNSLKPTSQNQFLITEMAKNLQSLQAQIQQLEKFVETAAKDFENAIEEANELLNELGIEPEEAAKEEDVSTSASAAQEPSVAPTPKPEVKKDEGEKVAATIAPKPRRVIKVVPTTTQLDRAERSAKKLVEKSLIFNDFERQTTEAKTRYRLLEQQTKASSYGNNPEITKYYYAPRPATYITLPGSSQKVKIAQPPSYAEMMAQQQRASIVQNIAPAPSYYQSTYSDSTAQAQQQQVFALSYLRALQEALRLYGRKPVEVVSNYLATFEENDSSQNQEQWSADSYTSHQF